MDLVSFRNNLFAKLKAHGIKPESLRMESMSSARRGSHRVLTVKGKGSDSASLELVKESLVGEEKDVTLDISFGVSVGDQCPDLDFFSCDEDANPITLKFSADDERSVVFLDFWATWCPPCQAPMAHNQEILNNHPSWRQHNKAEIVCVALDDDTKAVRDRAAKRGWRSLTLMWAGDEGFESRACTAFGVQGIPFCALVHRGVIRWMGHPSSIDVEAAMEALVDDNLDEFNAVVKGDDSADEEDEGDEEEDDDDDDDGDDEDDEDEEENEDGELLDDAVFESRFERAQSVMAACIAEVSAQTFGSAAASAASSSSSSSAKAPKSLFDNIEIVVIAKRRLTATSDSGTRYHIALAGNVPEFLAESILDDALLPRLQEIFPSLNDACDRIPIYSVSRAKTCSLCQQNMPADEPQFVCLECCNEPEDEQHAHCIKCHIDSIPAGKLLAHSHILYYIPPAATDAELDSITASQDNVDPLPNFEDDEDGCVIPTGSLKHPARCDNCTKQVIGCRYKCANCRDFDFCEACFTESQSDVALSQSMIAAMKRTNHDLAHCFVVIPWRGVDASGYDEYYDGDQEFEDDN